MSNHERLSGPPSGPHSVEDLGHGHSTAMWAGVGVAFLGFLIGTIGVVMLNWTVLAVGCVVVLLSLVVGRVLSLMGLGAYTREAIDAPAGKDGDTVGIK